MTVSVVIMTFITGQDGIHIYAENLMVVSYFVTYCVIKPKQPPALLIGSVEGSYFAPDMSVGAQIRFLQPNFLKYAFSAIVLA